MVLDLFKNPYFLIPVISFFVAQSAKFAIRLWRSEGGGGLRSFFGSGDMPSSHTAMVVSLAWAAAFESGLGGPEFGISFVLAAIVVYDALGVRRAVGEHGGVLLHLIERARVPKEQREEFNLGKVLGHRPIEIFAGASLATVISFALEYEKWWDWFYGGLSDISDTDIKVFYGIAGGAVALGILVLAIFRRRNLRRLPTSKAIARAASRGLIAPGIVALILTWMLQERIDRFDSALWLFIVLVWGLTVLAIASIKTFNGAGKRLKVEKEHFSEEKKRLRESRRKHKKRR